MGVISDVHHMSSETRTISCGITGSAAMGRWASDRSESGAIVMVRIAPADAVCTPSHHLGYGLTPSGEGSQWGENGRQHSNVALGMVIISACSDVNVRVSSYVLHSARSRHTGQGSIRTVYCLRDPREVRLLYPLICRSWETGSGDQQQPQPAL